MTPAKLLAAIMLTLLGLWALGRTHADMGWEVEQ